MREYAVIAPSFWTGRTGRSLRQDREAQVLALYLCTCPSANMLGLYYLPLPLICHETGLSEEGALKGLQRLSEDPSKGSKGSFCHYDKDNEVVFVPQMAKFQIGESLDEKDNRIKGIQRQLDQYKNSLFYEQFLEIYGEKYHLISQKTKKGLPRGSEGASKTLRSQDQDQDQDQDILKSKDISESKTSESHISSEAEKTLKKESEKEKEEKPPKNRRPKKGDVVLAPEQEVRFAKFWEAYPKNEGTGECRAIWKSLDPSEALLEKMLATIQRFTSSRKWREGIIPMPATWLRQGRWDDTPYAEPPPLTRQQAKVANVRQTVTSLWERIDHAHHDTPDQKSRQGHLGLPSGTGCAPGS